MKKIYSFLLIGFFFLIHLFWMISIIRFADQIILCIIFNLLFLFSLFFITKNIRNHCKYIAASFVAGFIGNYVSIFCYYLLFHPNKDLAFKFIEQTFQSINGFYVNFIITGLLCGGAIVGPIYAEIIYRVHLNKTPIDS